MKQIKTKSIAKRASALVASIVLLLSASGGLAAAQTVNSLDNDFGSVAGEFGVPKEVLMALSYNQSRWEDNNDKPSASGGYGIAHLTTETELEDGRGDPDRPAKKRASQSRHTLDEAAALLNVPTDQLKKDDRQNLRGAAALLAKYARETHEGQLPKDVNDWYDAVAQMSSSPDIEGAQDFADSVYGSIQNGADRQVKSGETIKLPKKDVRPDKSRLNRISKPSSPRKGDTECPHTLHCKFVPARFAQNNPEDATDYGNYDQAHRPKDMQINKIVIHDTEGSYQSAIDWFRDPASYVAAHYVIRSSDGEVTQMVKTKDVGWHAGNWYENMHSIGIEHEGIASEGAAWYTEEMYQASAKLVRYLAEKYNIPLDREHIVGHDQYHAPTPARVPTMHWDPGPYWDWDHYMDLLQGRYHPMSTDNHINTNSLTIAPQFANNKPPVTECTDTGCTQLPAQPSNFVYLRTAPQDNAPYLTDAGMHPDGASGTTEISDWSAKATSGQHFAVAERQGEWIAIWFGGQKGWFYNPSTGHTALPSWQKLITPKDGAGTIPVYGRPVPEASAFASTGAPVLAVVPLQYTIPSGQAYPVYDFKPKNDYFHVLSFDRSTPGDGTITIGNEKYLAISYNHRQAYVKASDIKQL